MRAFAPVVWVALVQVFVVSMLASSPRMPNTATYVQLIDVLVSRLTTVLKD